MNKSKYPEKPIKPKKLEIKKDGELRKLQFKTKFSNFYLKDILNNIGLKISDVENLFVSTEITYFGEQTETTLLVSTLKGHTKLEIQTAALEYSKKMEQYKFELEHYEQLMKTYEEEMNNYHNYNRENDKFMKIQLLEAEIEKLKEELNE